MDTAVEAGMWLWWYFTDWCWMDASAKCCSSADVIDPRN